MASAMEVEARQPSQILPDEQSMSPIEPSTPLETGPPDSSQVTLPSTEIPPSPIEPSESFKTEVNDDRAATTVIPSSLTPPPSTQVTAHNGNARRAYSNSQQTTFFSPPATILAAMRDREVGSGYEPPSPQRVLEASADQLRAMLQSCIAEHQRLKMETAHHKLQNNLLSLQADEDSKRAAVEHDMVRREVDALRMAEHSRQARRELSTASDTHHAKYLQMKTWYEAAMEENEMLHRKMKVAKKLIQQKEEETISLSEERDMLLTRIRENREHFQSLCSPGGIFHNILTPKQQAVSTPQQHRATPRQTPKSVRRDEREEHGLSALLQAMSQDNNANNNNSAPSTPITSHRLAPRIVGKHHRNSQSMSSLPTTPLNRPNVGHSGLLPSVDLVPQTEPPRRYGQRHAVPVTPVARPEHRRRKSRESTISADDNEELARQALQSVAAAQSFASRGTRSSRRGSPRESRQADEEVVEDELADSQATQAATEMLRRDARQSFEVANTRGSRDQSPAPAERSATMQAKLLANIKGSMDKRKFSGSHNATEDARREPASPAKKMRGGSGLLEEQRRVGLGIQYSQ
ncbi:hypothetical protein HJFPF1_08812 [Paramyrothecium foliicola]|nr:hypothetical protein HJFPF1_08812 [Paramyrothecium foliicola]